MLAPPFIGLPLCHTSCEPSAAGTWGRGATRTLHLLAAHLTPGTLRACRVPGTRPPSARGLWDLRCRAAILARGRGAVLLGGTSPHAPRGAARIPGPWGPPNRTGGRGREAGEDTEGLALRKRERRENGQKQPVTVSNAIST